MKEGSEYYFYHNDHLGTPQKLTAVNGAVVWSALYTAFGEAQVIPASSVENCLRFAGQYYDDESGLHYNYFRFYDPMIGRYLKADPIGLDGGINLYAYVQCNPLSWGDPWGLKIDKVCLGLCLGDKAMSAAVDIFVPGGGFLPFDSSILQSIGGYKDSWAEGGFFDTASAVSDVSHSIMEHGLSGELSKVDRARELADRKVVRKGKRAGRFKQTFNKLNKIRKIVGKFGGIAKLLTIADYLVKNRNPGPEGQVRVQRLCHLYGSMLLNGQVVPTTLDQGVTDEPISEVNTNYLALPISYCLGSKISFSNIKRCGRYRSW
ncbi:MAG: hypothetical protein GY702_11070 [Desulfobulbaceae bacterium]|nr:hypothetical protein [Desulfobulbaceae bacterium]